MKATYSVEIDVDVDDVDELDNIIRQAVDGINESLPLDRAVSVRANREGELIYRVSWTPEGDGAPLSAERIAFLRGELEAERISYGELAEIQSAFEQIDPALSDHPANATAADMLDELEARS